MKWNSLPLNAGTKSLHSHLGAHALSGLIIASISHRAFPELSISVPLGANAKPMDKRRKVCKLQQSSTSLIAKIWRTLFTVKFVDSLHGAKV
ncbi:MAG: hypothetical protein NZ805_08725 [Armatimonadetes bacterium]|nr:hypothetical protein [Armatimonadota bacterium]MDW8028120.1 hypothetical protein [Armatimonadota bacterium]